MNAARLAVNRVHRLQSSLILTLAGALLLLSVATGEARAATVTPSPSGGEDVGGIDGLTFVGLQPPECSGLYGAGKTVIDLGVPAEIEDPDDATEMIANPAFAEALASVDASLLASNAPVFLDGESFPLEDVGPTVVGIVALVCVDVGDVPNFADFNAPFKVAFAIDTGDVACSGDLHMFVWSPDSLNGEVLFRSAPSGAPESGAPEWEYYVDSTAVDDDASEYALILGQEAAEADVLDCTGSTSTAAVPVSMLALSCEPTVVSVGQQITCEVTGGDPNATILWSASASPAFAGHGVTLGADGRGSFSFAVPASARGRAITVELVEWDRSALVQVAGTAIVPSGVPAGEGSGPQRGLLLGGVALLAAAVVRSRRGRGVLEHTG